MTGDADVAGSIRRMAAAHATTLPDDWTWQVATSPMGAQLDVTAPEGAAPEGEVAWLRAIDYLGLLADGAHHQAHHGQIARGANPH